MTQATLPILGTGAIGDPERPDFSSVLSAGERIMEWELLSKTATEMTVSYRKAPMVDGDINLLREQVKGTALFDDSAWNALDAAGKANFVRTVLQRLGKYLFQGEP